MAQKSLDSIMVNCLASSRGSKSRMLHCVLPSLLPRKALSWLLVTIGDGTLLSARVKAEFEAPVLLIEDTKRGTRAPALTSVTLEVSSASLLPAAGMAARSFPVANARITPRAAESLSPHQWLSSQPLKTL